MKYRYQMNECSQVASEFLLENVIVPLIMHKTHPVRCKHHLPCALEECLRSLEHFH